MHLRVSLMTRDGRIVTADLVTEITYTKVCPYCDREFETTEEKRIYCRDSHKVMYCQKGIAHAAN